MKEISRVLTSLNGAVVIIARWWYRFHGVFHTWNPKHCKSLTRIGAGPKSNLKSSPPRRGSSDGKEIVIWCGSQHQGEMEVWTGELLYSLRNWYREGCGGRPLSRKSAPIYHHHDRVWRDPFLSLTGLHTENIQRLLPWKASGVLEMNRATYGRFSSRK